MIFIAHRGNIDGKNSKLENSPEYIQTALDAGYHVEIDIWFDKGSWWTGHDRATYPFKFDVTDHTIYHKWFHCKNLDALHEFTKYYKLHGNRINFFWHEDDKFALTSQGFIWTYPGYELSPQSIAVLPELAHYHEYDLTHCYGICTDFIKLYDK